MIGTGTNGRRAKADIFRNEASPLAVAMAEQDRATIAMVQAALRDGRMRLAYQPVVLASDPTRTAFHEGLIRVLDPSGRAIPARDFVAAVETTETGRLLDCAALEMGLATLAAQPHLRIAVNMSARSIGFPRWMRILRRGLAAGSGIGERLILEITEGSAMMVPEIVTAFMDEMQMAGIAFALDDFGAGFTSFRYLREFFFDIIKIDGQFIRNVAQEPDNQMLTQALVSIGRHFEMVTVAESVETREDAVWLQSIGIDCMQGYLFGAPTTQPAWATAEAARRRA